MSMFGLTSSVASLIAPVLGGALSDQFGGRTIWLGGGVIGLLAIGAFFWLTVLEDKRNNSKILSTNSAGS